MQNEEHK